MNDKFSFKHVEINIPLGRVCAYIMLAVDIQG